ncbi:DUF6311 domain-containing protein [Xylophilus sp. GOD-11R]|uniref:DUF6311 domain-containing protein n=1 Tax=Xylophilus sp. GOD-11R TaxID=3089814 RepID=UPI00298D34AD|nr:DUF6311 domain-containing protein [Xylophilus sp. GOD-11R]WPB57259.1 DUF6311 domain-containing protein [Xylophilus sp. GOD-11R]
MAAAKSGGAPMPQWRAPAHRLLCFDTAAWAPFPSSIPYQMSSRAAVRSPANALLAGLGLGALIFLLVWGITPLDPRNIEWMTNPFAGDFTFSSIAALAYLHDSWSFPPGVIKNLVYPALTSTVFADSIPLLAFLAKVVATLTGTTFQYFGLWGLLCCMLQGGFATAILHRYSRHLGLALIGALLVIAAPFFYGRMFIHVSMGGQWVLLFPLALIAYRDMPRIARWEVVSWVIAAMSTVSVMAYFAPMVMVLMVLHYWLRAQTAGIGKAVSRLALSMLIGIPGMLALLWLGGGTLPDNVSGGLNYGAIPWNLASFIDPSGYSRIFPGFAVNPTQPFAGESYMWLGTGVLAGAVLLLAMRAFWPQTVAFPSWTRVLPYVVCSFVLLAFAATNIVRFGPYVWFTYPLSEEVQHAFDSFRSSARIAWPVWYLIVFAVAGGISSLNLPLQIRAFMLSAVVALQAWDGSSQWGIVHRFQESRQPPALASPFWSHLDRAGKNLYFLPFWGLTSEPVRAQIYLGAIQAGVTSNIYWLGRYPMNAISDAVTEKMAALVAGRREPDDILLFNHVPYLAGVKLGSDSQAYLVDGLVVVARPGLADRQAGVRPVRVRTETLAAYLTELEKRRSGRLILLGGGASKPAAAPDDATRRALEKLGFGLLAQSQSEVDLTYAAVMLNGEVREQVMEHGPTRLDAGWRSPVDFSVDLIPGNTSQPALMIGAETFTGTVFGLNIVVYDLDRKEVVERAAFGSYSPQPGVVLTAE